MVAEKRNTETPMDIIHLLQDFIGRFLHFSDESVTLPLALYIIGTYLFMEFDAFPYVLITSDTKRSGKTTLADIMSFCCSNPRQFAAMMSAPATMFKIIDAELPTIFFDEAEELSGEGATMMRSVINVGYRRGQTIPRWTGKFSKEYKTYCPKVFILIGSTFDTLQDRSIIVRMTRGVPRARFAYDACQAEGKMFREAIEAVLQQHGMAISEAYQQIRETGLAFLTARDEQIWTSLFSVATVLCPERITELSRVAVDLCMEKTLDKRDYRVLLEGEKQAEQDEYVTRLLQDVGSVMAQDDRKPKTGEMLVEVLRNVPTGPWRKFRGTGLTVHNIADMLSATGVKAKVTRFGNGRTGSKTLRAYHYADVTAALKRNTETS